MPTPDRTSLDAIVTAASDILESDGLVGLTMNAVATRVGVRPPSLYKRVQGRDELIRLVAEAALTEIGGQLDAATTVVELANAFRAFGKRHPAAFQLVMTPGAGTPVARDEFGAAASANALRLAAELAGERDALSAARLLTAWATGFTSMELNGNFRLGGDVEEAWDFGLTRLVASLRPDN